MSTESLAVIYIARGASAQEFTSCKLFFDAYSKNMAGCEHELIVIFKGWESCTQRSEITELAIKNKAKIYSFDDQGFDWGAYIKITKILSHDYLCFLNTNSRPRTLNWLSTMYEAVKKIDNIGVVAATGSWGSLSSVLPLHSAHKKYNSSIYYLIRLSKNIIKFLKNIIYFQKFPNIHIRSNGFIIERSLFDDYISNKNIPKNKYESYKLESGRGSLSKYLLKKNKILLVVGANGKIYLPSEWPKSNTYRCGTQENLLICDKQTDDYQFGTDKYRRGLILSAWGKKYL